MADPGSGPASSGPAALARRPAEPGGGEIPRAVLRSWDEAEARLFPLVMARPDVYQQSVSVIQQLLRPPPGDLPRPAQPAGGARARRRPGRLTCRRRGRRDPAGSGGGRRVRDALPGTGGVAGRAGPAGGPGPGPRPGPVLGGGGGDRLGRSRALRPVPADRGRGRHRAGGHHLDRAGRDPEPRRVPPGPGADRPGHRRPCGSARPSAATSTATRSPPPCARPGPKSTETCLDATARFIKDGERSYRI